MHEYCLMQHGEVTTIITTSRPLSELRGFYIGFTVTPVEQVPLATLQRYPYWNQRP